jgi:hypothetical protein
MRRTLRRWSLLPLLLVTAVAVVPLGSDAAPLPGNCTKVQGTVTCTTFDGPGKNQAGVGTTTNVETQGNTSNKSPAPQDLTDTLTCKPPKSQGAPCP